MTWRGSTVFYNCGSCGRRFELSVAQIKAARFTPGAKAFCSRVCVGRERGAANRKHGLRP